jgi:hypothetical protein
MAQRDKRLNLLTFHGKGLKAQHPKISSKKKPATPWRSWLFSWLRG